MEMTQLQWDNPKKNTTQLRDGVLSFIKIVPVLILYTYKNNKSMHKFLPCRVQDVTFQLLGN